MTRGALKQVRIAIVGLVCASVAAISMTVLTMASPRAASTSPGAIYVANTFSDAVTIYPTSANGNFAPYVTISGSNTGLAGPDGIALDAAGNIYVANQDTDSVTMYSAGSGGNVPPKATLVGAPDKIFEPAGVAIDSSGNVYVASPDLDIVTEYPPLSSQSGTVTPDPVATFVSSDLSEPVGIDVGSRGHIYVANPGNGSVISLIPSDGPPTVGVDITDLVAPFGVTLDAGDNIYVADAGAEAIDQYSHLQGVAKLVASIVGSNTVLGEPVGVAVDSLGNIYVANQGLESVTIYAAGSNGNVAPISSITGDNTNLNLPGAIAIGPAVSPSATPTATASSTASAIPSVTSTPTAISTPTATSTATATPTPTPTPTLAIGGTEVIAGNPPSLPFPAVAAKKTATAQFRIINTGDEVTGFTLQTNIAGADGADFKVGKSSTCVTNNNSVGKNKSCIYVIKETPQNPPESAQMTITATPKNGGQPQMLILNLIGGAS